MSNQFLKLQGEILGIKLSTLIKPFYSIYQMIFGYILIPTENILIIPLFSGISFGLILIAFKMYKIDKDLFLMLFFIGILPLFSIFFFFESLSFAGSTKLYAKHVMLFYPILIFVIVVSTRYLPKSLNFTFIALIVCSQLMGFNAAITHKTFENWDEISKKISLYSPKDTLLISEPIALDILSLRDLDLPEISNVRQKNSSVELHGKNEIIFLLRHFNLYTKLSLEENWEQGSENSSDVDYLSNLLKLVERDFKLIDSEIAYPLFLYIFSKEQKKEEIRSAEFWGHHLKDISLPIHVDNQTTLLSSFSVHPGHESFFRNRGKIILNTENLNKLEEKSKILGFIQCGEEITFIEEGVNVWDIFSDLNDKQVNEEKVSFSWIHKPLLSSSITYKGSWLQHTASTYELELSFCNQDLLKLVNTSENTDIRIWTKK